MIIPPKAMSYQQFRSWFRERCGDDGIMYDEEDTWNQYSVYLERITEENKVMGAMRVEGRAGYFSFAGALRHYFQLTLSEARTELQRMTLEDRDKYAEWLKSEGYINIGDPRIEIPHIPIIPKVASDPIMLPHDVPVPVKVLSGPPPKDENLVVPEVNEGFTVGDVHPTMVKAA